MSLRRKQIEDLEPRERRFDVALAQDFVISVHPNGIKTWAFIDERAGQLHRKTLGVWPEMNIDAAQKAVAAARDTRSRMVAAAQDASAIPSPTDRTKPVSRMRNGNSGPAWVIPAVLLAVVILGTAGWQLGRQLSPEPATSSGVLADARNVSVEPGAITASNVATGTEANEAAVAESTQMANRVNSLETDVGMSIETRLESSGKPDQAKGAGPDQQRPGLAVTNSDPQSGLSTDLPTDNQSDGQDPDSSAVVSQPLATGSIAGGDAGMSSSSDDGIAEAATGSDGGDLLPAPAVGSTSEISRQAKAATSLGTSPATPANRATRSAAAIAPAAPVSSDSGNVQRALLSSGIENREPIDALGASVVVSDDGPTTLYYFNDLRRMTGRTVSHRWEKDGAVVSQRSMTIGGWRWRLYSSVDLPPDASGEWSVQLLDENGGELHRQDFTLVRGFP